MASDLDDVDRGILFLLQDDARNTTAIEMAERLDVSPSTVRNRIERLEDDGILTGYQPQIDYTRLDVPLVTAFVVTAAPTRRHEAVESLLEVEGVLEVQELLGGRENIHVKVLARDTCHLSEITQAIHELDVEIERTEIAKQRRMRSPSIFETALESVRRDVDN